MLFLYCSGSLAILWLEVKWIEKKTQITCTWALPLPHSLFPLLAIITFLMFIYEEQTLLKSLYACCIINRTKQTRIFNFYSREKVDSDWRISLDHHRLLTELADIIVDIAASKLPCMVYEKHRVAVVFLLLVCRLSVLHYLHVNVEKQSCCKTHIICIALLLQNHFSGHILLFLFTFST